MTIKIKHKRSAVAGKAPLPADLEYGEIAVNYEKTEPALYVKDTANAVRKIGEQPDATETAKGIVQLADAAAITAGTAGRVVDAAQLKAAAPDATETVKGIVELATAQEAWDRADATRVVSPIALDGTYIRNDHRGQPHGIGGVDKNFLISLQLSIGDGGGPSPANVISFVQGSDPTKRVMLIGRYVNNNTFICGTEGATGRRIEFDTVAGSSFGLSNFADIAFSNGGKIGVQHENILHGCMFRAAATGNGLFYSTTGSGTWVSLSVASDKRIKALAPTQRRAYPHSPGLDLIEQLRPVRFNYDQNRSLSLPDGQRWGFLAQEVQAVLPEAVQIMSEPNVLGDGTSFDDAIPDLLAFESDAAYQLIAVLTSAVQELRASNAALAARITTLEGVTG